MKNHVLVTAVLVGNKSIRKIMLLQATIHRHISKVYFLSYAKGHHSNKIQLLGVCLDFPFVFFVCWCFVPFNRNSETYFLLFVSLERRQS